MWFVVTYMITIFPGYVIDSFKSFSIHSFVYFLLLRPFLTNSLKLFVDIIGFKHLNLVLSQLFSYIGIIFEHAKKLTTPININIHPVAILSSRSYPCLVSYQNIVKSIYIPNATRKRCFFVKIDTMIFAQVFDLVLS